MYPDIFESATFSFRIQNFPCPHVIEFNANLFFSTLESGFKKNPDSLDACGRKPYQERKSCGFKNWKRVDGALRRGYTCTDLNEILVSLKRG